VSNRETCRQSHTQIRYSTRTRIQHVFVIIVLYMGGHPLSINPFSQIQGHDLSKCYFDFIANLHSHISLYVYRTANVSENRYNTGTSVSKCVRIIGF
jgi:hypothetical protein